MKCTKELLKIGLASVFTASSIYLLNTFDLPLNKRNQL